jgi:HlyD family secretion protein
MKTSNVRYVVACGLIFGGAAALSLVGCGGGMPVQAAKVRQGSIREFVDEQAKTRLPRVYDVTVPFAARVERIELDAGAKVHKGDVVARLVQSDLANELAEAKAAVERLDASIRENSDVNVEKGAYNQALKFVESMVSTVAAAESRKDSGKGRLDFAIKNFNRVKQLYDTRSGAVTQEQMDRAEMEKIQADADYRQDVLVAESIKAIEAATGLMPRMVSDYIARKDLSGAVLEKQKLEAEARLRQAQIRQERGTLKSPIDGVILERREYNEQHQPAGAVLLRIGDLERLEVEADVLSQEAVYIRPGQVVEIYGPSISRALGNRDPEEGVRGTVDRVYPAGFTKLSSLGVEQQRVKVAIKFSDGVLFSLLEKGIGVDYRVRVRIVTSEKEQAFVVPRSAIFRGADGGWQTFIIRGGRARLQPVEVGLMNDDRVEIKKGMEAEETVVLAPESNLADGAAVSPILR